jgi:hypothetical protein
VAAVGRKSIVVKVLTKQNFMACIRAIHSVIHSMVVALVITTLMKFIVINTRSNCCDFNDLIRPREIAVGLRVTMMRATSTFRMLLHGVVTFFDIFSLALMPFFSTFLLGGREGRIVRQSVFLTLQSSRQQFSTLHLGKTVRKLSFRRYPSYNCSTVTQCLLQSYLLHCRTFACCATDGAFSLQGIIQGLGVHDKSRGAGRSVFVITHVRPGRSAK